MPLLFLIFINDLADDFFTNAKLLLTIHLYISVVHYVNASPTELNGDLNKLVSGFSSGNEF